VFSALLESVVFLFSFLPILEVSFSCDSAYNSALSSVIFPLGLWHLFSICCYSSGDDGCSDERKKPADDLVPPASGVQTEGLSPPMASAPTVLGVLRLASKARVGSASTGENKIMGEKVTVVADGMSRGPSRWPGRSW
jgi:hypothetical protein